MIKDDFTQALAQAALDATSKVDLVEDHTRRCLLDWLGVVLAADGVISSEAAWPSAVSTGSTDILRRQVVSTAEAALVNSMHAHLLDYDDFHLDVPGHASAAVVGASLAQAESSSASFSQLFQGMVAGVEAVTILGKVAGGELFNGRWHPTAILGSVGAAVAASVVQGADAQTLRNASGLAALQSSGTMRAFGSVGKPWQVGCAARNGIHASDMAAYLGQLETIPDQLGGSDGVLALLTGKHLGSSDLASLGSVVPRIQDTQFKRYATCFGTHAAADAACSIAGTTGFIPEDVVQVDVAVGEDFRNAVLNPAPKTLMEAKFSASAVVALSLLQRPPVHPQFFSATTVRDREYRRLESVTKASADASIKGAGARVSVLLRDGSKQTLLVEEQKPSSTGDEWAAVIQKFQDITQHRLSSALAGQVIELISSAPGDTPVAEIIERICA
jgi:2-methylcitrate dehydratase PrpD